MKRSTPRSFSNLILIAAFGSIAVWWTGCATVPSGSTLHAAIEQGKLDRASELIKKQKSLDVRDANGNTALHLAATKGYTNLTDELLSAGAPLNLVNGLGATPLYDAAAAGQTGSAQLLIDRGALLDAPAKDLITPLGIASANGHLEAVQLLVSKGAALHARTSDGLTPLVLATWRGQEPVVEFLLASGADPNIRTTEGFTALMETAGWSSNRMAKMLIDRGAKVNACTTNGVTALMLAARYGNLDLTQLLIEHGADVDATNAIGEMALYVAAFNGQANVVPALCANGANLNHRAVNGRSALHAAALRRDGDQLEYLVRRGAQPHLLEAGLENAYASALGFQYHAWLLLEQTNAIAARQSCAAAAELFDKAETGYEQVAAQLGKQIRHERWMAALAVTLGVMAEGLAVAGAQYQHRQYAQMSALRSASVGGTGHAGYFQTMSSYRAPTPLPIGAVGIGIAAASQRTAIAADMGSGRKIMEARVKNCREAASTCKATLACLDSKAANASELQACLEAVPRADAESKFRKRRALSEILQGTSANPPL